MGDCGYFINDISIGLLRFIGGRNRLEFLAETIVDSANWLFDILVGWSRRLPFFQRNVSICFDINSNLTNFGFGNG